MIPFPYNLVGAIAVVFGTFYWGWTAQGWHRDSQEKERVEAQAETDRLAHLSNLKRLGVAAQARDRALGRAVSDRADADAALTELDRLRAQSSATLRAASISLEACVVGATALDDVFKSCAGRYAELGAKADRHVNDIKTLSEAWPE